MKLISFHIFCILVGAGAYLIAEQDVGKSLTSCVVKILEDIDYKKYYHLMDITVMNINDDLKLSSLHKVNGARFITRRFFWDPGNISNVIYIVMSENYQELERGLNEVTSDKFWNPTARFIIVLQSYEDYSLHDVKNLLHEYNIYFKVSLISRDGDDYAIYRYNFTKANSCFKTGNLKLWARCSDYHTEKKLPVLYGGHIRNCRYKFITRNLWPFMNFDSYNLGTEEHFITLFEKQFGVKIDFQEFGKVDKYGNVMNNITKIMVQKLAANEFEGAVGGYALNSENYFGNISYSYPMNIDHMFYYVAHASYLEQWVAVLYQSSKTCIVIGLLFVTFCVAASLLSIFRTEKDISYNVLTVFGYLLNKKYVKRIESGWPQAIIFSSLLFTSFILPYAIQANLCSVTTQPVRGYEPKEPKDLDPYYPFLYTEWQHRKFFRKHYDCGTRLHCLSLVKRYPQSLFFTVVSDAHYQVYQWQLTDDQCQMSLYRLREPYNSIYRTVFLRRGSVLIPYLNKFTLQLLTTGVIDKFANDIYLRELLRCKSRYRPEHVPLTLSNFYYIFMILIGGYCLSILMFVYEIWTGLRPKTTNELEIME